MMRKIARLTDCQMVIGRLIITQDATDRRRRQIRLLIGDYSVTLSMPQARALVHQLASFVE
jgi:hypothetical protein